MLLFEKSEFMLGFSDNSESRDPDQFFAQNFEMINNFKIVDDPEFSVTHAHYLRMHNKQQETLPRCAQCEGL